MRKRVVKILDLPSSGGNVILLILSAFFLMGGLAGCALVDLVNGGGGDALEKYLEGYLSAVSSGIVVRPEVFASVWETLRWPLFVLALGLTPIGLLCIPALFLVRGFLLSFAIASFFRVLGAAGLVLAFAVFGLAGLISIPAFFLLGVQGFFSAGAMTGRLLGESQRLPLIDRVTLLRICVCAAAVCACCLIDYFVVPDLLGSLAGVLLG